MKGFRTFLIVAAAIFGSVMSVFAQTHYEGNLFVGAKGGIGFSRVAFHPSVRQKMPIGAHAGFTVRYIEENHFGIIGELNFVQRGWEENFEEDPFSYRRTLNYIELPVLAHIYFGSSRAHFFFNAGPQIGLMVGESTSSNFDYRNPESVPGFPLKDRQIAQYNLKGQKKLDFGITAGIGGEFFINSRNSITLEGRFYYGLGNVVKTGRTETFSSANSLGVLISAGYWFRVK